MSGHRVIHECRDASTNNPRALCRPCARHGVMGEAPENTSHKHPIVTAFLPPSFSLPDSVIAVSEFVVHESRETVGHRGLSGTDNERGDSREEGQISRMGVIPKDGPESMDGFDGNPHGLLVILDGDADGRSFGHS